MNYNSISLHKTEFDENYILLYDNQTLSVGYIVKIILEYLQKNISHDKISNHKTLLKPISTCVQIYMYRSHFLILTLYLLVFIILALSQINFSLRKRKLQTQIENSFINLERNFHRY